MTRFPTFHVVAEVAYNEYENLENIGEDLSESENYQILRDPLNGKAYIVVTE